MPPKSRSFKLLVSLRKKAIRRGVQIRSIAGPSTRTFAASIPEEMQEWKAAIAKLYRAGFSQDRDAARAMRKKESSAQMQVLRSLHVEGVLFAAGSIGLSQRAKNELKESYEYTDKLQLGHPLRKYHQRRRMDILTKLPPIKRSIFMIQLGRHSHIAREWVREMGEKLLTQTMSSGKA